MPKTEDSQGRGLSEVAICLVAGAALVFVAGCAGRWGERVVIRMREDEARRIERELQFGSEDLRVPAGEYDD